MAETPRRPARSSPGGKKRPRRQDPTERVRIKAKAPLIERKDDFFDEDEGETVLHEEATPKIRAKAATAVFFDEDRTELAPPPRRPKRSSSRREPKQKLEPQTIPAARPGRPMQIPGTEAAAALAARAKVERLAERLPNVRIPALRTVAPLVSAKDLARLEAALLGELDGRGGSSVGSVRGPSNRLLESELYQALVLEDRALLLGALAPAAEKTETWKLAAALLEAISKGASAATRRRSLEIYAALEARHRPTFVEVAERRLHRKPVLEDRDLEGGALLDHLHTLATLPKLPTEIEERGLRVRDVLTLVLATLAKPARIALEESADGVLAALEFGLAETSPGEYTRLWRHLLTGSMSVALAGERTIQLGKQLERTDVAFTGTNTPLRVGLEVLAGLIRPRRGPVRAAYLMPGGQGVDADVVSHALSLLYGVPYAVAAGPAAISRVLGSVGREPERVPPVFVSVLYEGGERLFVFERAGSSRLFVRSPHGASNKTKGSDRKRPAREVEEPDRGLESMPIEFLEKHVGVIIAPTT